LKKKLNEKKVESPIDLHFTFLLVFVIFFFSFLNNLISSISSVPILASIQMEATIADVLYDYAQNRLSQEQIKRIYSAGDLLRTIEDDDEEEIKDEIWQIVKHSLHWKSLIDMIRMTIEEEDEEEESSDTE
jgi:uncharacterized membrane protein YgaE (UPF0421/DUF939 family)